MPRTGLRSLCLAAVLCIRSADGAAGASNLRGQGTQDRACVNGTTLLSTADAVVAKLSAVLDDATCCGVGKPEQYEVAANIYGLISGPLVLTDGHMYPSDKAVAWLSNHVVLENWANGFDGKNVCCNAGSLEKCLCQVADIASISEPTGDYELVVAEDPAVVSPRWTNAKFQEAFVESYSWVFGDVKLAPRWKSIEDLQHACAPRAETWEALQSFNVRFAPGVDAYRAIQANGTYGGQMRELRCGPATTDGSGGCECLGRRAGLPYCHAETDVVLFCGAGGVESCDPSAFLCPASGLPVGYVRAYLHKFFDAIPFFRGTGYSDLKDEAPEFIMRNTKASTDNTRVKVRTTEAKDLTGACAES